MLTRTILFFSLILSFSAYAQHKLEIESAKNWLKMVDSGKYAESWKQTDPYFQAQVSRDQWQMSLNGARTPLGKVISRRLNGSKSFTSLPGAPDGEYVVMTFSTSYAYKKSSTETITVKKSDGSWRVVGYFIK